MKWSEAEAEAAPEEGEGAEGAEQQTTEVARESPVKAKAKARSKKEVKPISKEELQEKVGKTLEGDFGFRCKFLILEWHDWMICSAQKLCDMKLERWPKNTTLQENGVQWLCGSTFYSFQ